MIKTALTAISRDPGTAGLSQIISAASQWRDLYARVAIDSRVRDDAFALRYQCYRNIGYLEPNESERFSDPYDDSLAATTLVLYAGDRPVGSIRGVIEERDENGVISGAKTNATAMFPEEMNALFASTSPHPVRRVMELTRLVRHPDYGTDALLVFGLFRMACCLVLQQGVDAATCVVRRSHMAFYRRMQWQKRSEPLPYPGLHNFEAGLMACYLAQYDDVKAAFPLLNVVDNGREAYIRMMEGSKVPVFGHD